MKRASLTGQQHPGPLASVRWDKMVSVPPPPPPRSEDVHTRSSVKVRTRRSTGSTRQKDVFSCWTPENFLFFSAVQVLRFKAQNVVLSLKSVSPLRSITSGLLSVQRLCFGSEPRGTEGQVLDTVDLRGYLDSLVSPATVCLLCFNSSGNRLFSATLLLSSSPSVPHEILLSFLSSSKDLDLGWFICLFVFTACSMQGETHGLACNDQSRRQETMEDVLRRGLT